MLSPKATRVLITVQSALTGLQSIAAAAILGDVIGAKPAALFIVLVTGAQQAVSYYSNKSVAEAVHQVETAVARADAATEANTSATAALIDGSKRYG